MDRTSVSFPSRGARRGWTSRRILISAGQLAVLAIAAILYLVVVTRGHIADVTGVR